GNDGVFETTQGTIRTQLRAQYGNSTADAGLRVRVSGDAGNTWINVLEVTPSKFTYGAHAVWHAGNDGAGSGLDADLLDGQDGSFYRNASNLNAGTLPAARFNDTSHGQRGGGNLHTVATPTTAGFMSAEDKAKLDGIEAGAEVNQNAFSRVAVAGQSAVQATAKTDTLNLSAGANIQITTSASDKRVVISSAHNHRQQYAELPVAVDRLGYGVVRGLKVTAKNPPGMSVIVEPGLAHLPSGQRIE